MKKTSICILLFIIFILFNHTDIYASSSATYFDGKAIKIEDPNNNIEILSNELTINADTSKINNEIVLKNTSNAEVNTVIDIPLENIELSTSIHDLSIIVNGVNVEYTKNDKGEYTFQTKLSAGSGKKLEISYYTDNNLRDAKVIKYNMDNFKGKKIGKVRIDIILNEKDVPLVQAIYPGHYTYDQFVITVEYYDLDITTITKDIIVTKETYKNLKYGREYELSEYDEKILNNIDELFENGLKVDFNQKNISVWNALYEYCGLKVGYSQLNVLDSSESILRYLFYKEAIKKEQWGQLGGLYGNNCILVDETIKKYFNEWYNSGENYYSTHGEDKALIPGKLICVEFVETVDEEELYVSKNFGGEFGGDEDISDVRTVLAPERQLLKTEVYSNARTKYLGERVIFVGEGISGENLHATDEEKIAYINAINADLYIRVELYEGKVDSEWGTGVVGYYRNSDKAIANAFFYERIPDEKPEGKILIKLDNEYIANSCEVPTVVQFIGVAKDIDGKKQVKFFFPQGFYNGIFMGLITTHKVLKTEEAQRMLNINKSNNNQRRNEALKKLKELQYIDDEQIIQQEILRLKQQEEQRIQQELLRLKQQEEERIQKSNNLIANNESMPSTVSLQTKDIIIFSIIGVLIIICILALIFEKMKSKNSRF